MPNPLVEKLIAALTTAGVNVDRAMVTPVAEQIVAAHHEETVLQPILREFLARGGELSIEFEGVKIHAVVAAHAAEIAK
jgi:hypothetical protein